MRRKVARERMRHNGVEGGGEKVGRRPPLRWRANVRQGVGSGVSLLLDALFLEFHHLPSPLFYLVG